VREGAAPVIRFNTKGGGKDIMELGQDDWVHHQDGDDLAACPLSVGILDHYQYITIPTKLFVTKSFIERQNIGPGDDVFMLGRFVNQEGRQRNTPVVRFGNISMMPWEEIMHPRAYTVESFLVETRSLGGFSGSPVFVYITPTSPRPAAHPAQETGSWLLGVDWGHLPIYEKIKEKNREEDVPEGWVVESNSGQMAVAPAWKLMELLEQEDLVMQRQQTDEAIAKRQQSSSVVLDMYPRNAEEHKGSAQKSDTFTKADFEDALDRVSRSVPPPDQES
jgi:hypothetical protein